ncbi:MAG: NAD-binding protein [Candidatus Eisenbacteria bacterium]|uniref:Trk system potassium uptake protein TrkA n=1 Tax=Eiseniibacteriota bacterium TaxID=2212470 RepID=A0A956NBT0_UNCEI|nr:NAD-binding protein [Candidatus Eisenbacteria bacterium]MCB9463242.1 NAD-binding protein [Candidatus Eisenbacteria bacterium]
MKGIVVGAGGTTRELLRRLGPAWEITVIEQDRTRLDLARAIRPFRALPGDGSSRVVLQRAGLADADALVAATNDDEVNLEVCRLAREAGIPRVVAISADPERITDYRDLQVPSFSPDRLTARRLEEGLESRKVSSQSFARGRAEAIEFEVAESSAVRGRSLKELRARSWVVGAVLRGEQLLIPHGDTVFEAGDLVTVVGSGADFAEIVRTFTSGRARFPLDFGKGVALALENTDMEPTLKEAAAFVQSTRASSLVLVHKDPNATRDEDERQRIEKLVENARSIAGGTELEARPVSALPTNALVQTAADESVGVIVRPLRPTSSPIGFLKARRAIDLARKTETPVLVSRGTFPYQRVLVPARRTKAGRSAARTAIDIAVQVGAELTAIAAVEPAFLASPEAGHEARLAIGFVREEATVLGQHVKGRIRRGNPGRVLLGAIREGSDLVVLGIDLHPKNRFQLSIAAYLVAQSPSSILIVPSRE